MTCRRSVSQVPSRFPVLCGLESCASVHHLGVRRRRPASSRPACGGCHSPFPGGSITSAPKKRAMEIIQEVEQIPAMYIAEAWATGARRWSDGFEYCYPHGAPDPATGLVPIRRRDCLASFGCCRRIPGIPDKAARIFICLSAMILVVDNYDSFVYNLVHSIQILGREVEVVNDHPLLADPDRPFAGSHTLSLVLYTGRGRYCVDLIRRWAAPSLSWACAWVISVSGTAFRYPSYILLYRYTQ